MSLLQWLLYVESFWSSLKGIKDVVNFVKDVPDFKQLDEQDQVIIIRNAAIEVKNAETITPKC